MSDLAARLAQAQELIDGKHLEDASSLIEEAARESPDNPWPPLLAAKIARMLGERARSRELLAQALGLGAEHAALLFSAYRFLCESGEDEAARDVLEGARARFPGDAPLLREDAQRASARNDWARAYALWSDLAQREPDSKEALHEVARSLEHSPKHDRRVVAVYGNCQAEYMTLLCNIVPALNYRYRFVPVTNHGYRHGQTRPPLPDEIGTADLLWEQFDQSASVDVRDRMRERLPREIRSVTYPAVTLTAFWPFACVDRRPGRVHANRNGFGDRVGLEIAALGLSREHVFERYMKRSREKMPNLRVLLERDRAVQQKRDDASDVQIGEFVFRNLRREQQFNAWGYPTGAVIAQIMLRLIETSGLEAGACLEQHVRTACEMAPSQVPAQLPMHPDVIQALDVEYLDAGSTYLWYGHRWTFEEYMTRYITLDSEW